MPMLLRKIHSCCCPTQQQQSTRHQQQHHHPHDHHVLVAYKSRNHHHHHHHHDNILSTRKAIHFIVFIVSTSVRLLGVLLPVILCKYQNYYDTGNIVVSAQPISSSSNTNNVNQYKDSRLLRHNQESYHRHIRGQEEKEDRDSNVTNVEGEREGQSCHLYYAKSMFDPSRFALYYYDQNENKPTSETTMAKDISFYQQEEFIVPIINPNMNEYSPWHEFVWESDILPSSILSSIQITDYLSDSSLDDHQQQQALEERYTLKVFIAGIGSIAACTRPPNNNVRGTLDHIQFQRDNHHTNSISQLNNYMIRPVDENTLKSGQMIINDCNFDDPNLQNNSDDESRQYKSPYPDGSLPVDGICMDTIQVRESTIPGIGRGAFVHAQRSFRSGDVVTTSPVLHFDRSQMYIVHQYMVQNPNDHIIPLLHRPHNIEYTSKVIGQQLLLNYCYGHPDSNMLLLPYGPGVNFINHSVKLANVEIRWSMKFGSDDATNIRYNTPIMELYEQSAYTTSMMIEFVAIRDISPNEEIFYNYGPNFVQAWERHLSEHQQHNKKNPFRHEIGVPLNGFYPNHWMKYDSKPYGDFIPSKLPPGQMAPIRWKDTAEIVTPWAFRIGLPQSVRDVLLTYCNRMGITKILQHVTIDGNGLVPGTETHMSIEGHDWYIQRPDAMWRSNLHWFSPGEAKSHEHYLQALSAAGFDTVLQGIGDYLGMDGLVAFHVTFIAVSFSNRGYLHHDVRETGARVYNIIVPLILSNDTGPELDLQSWKPDLPDDQVTHLGRYRYEYEVASMIGDGAMHATSACDYRTNQQMRMAATVYVADVNEVNADRIMQFYTQAYPPKDLDLLKSWIGRHWKRNDPSKTLPKPAPDHILVRDDNVSTNRSNLKGKWQASPSSGQDDSSQHNDKAILPDDLMKNSNDTPSEEL